MVSQRSVAVGGGRDKLSHYHQKGMMKPSSQPRPYHFHSSSSSSSSSSASSCGSSDSSDQETNPQILLTKKKLIRQERNRLSAMESRLKKERLIQDLTSRAQSLEIQNQNLHLLLSQALKLLNPSTNSTTTTSSSSSNSQNLVNNFSTKESAIVFH
jgi:hypothetical protein